MNQTRFDLEEQILICWNILEDIKLLSKKTQTGDLMNQDIVNYLAGVETIYSMKFESLFETLENMVKNGQIK